MANSSILAAFERMWLHVTTTLGGKADASALTSHTGDTSNPHGVVLSQLGVTATATELNTLDGITATVTELNYMDGVTSSVQTQLNDKEASGAAAALLNRSTSVITSDTNYTIYMARGVSLNSTDTTPTVNGTIAWTYE